MRTSAPVVLKFGGASLAHPREITRLIQEAQHEGSPVVLVASARQGVTDTLVELLAHPRALGRHRRLLQQLRELHPDLGTDLDSQFARLERLIELVERSYPQDPPLADRLLSYGERLAVHWLTGELRQDGIAAVPVEADHLGLITDNTYGGSCILFDRSLPQVRRGIGRLLSQGKLPVITGFFGRSLEGRVATLGRGGSDYSAAGLGALLGASRVDLIKRDVSVLSADPRLVPGARAIPRLSYEEAEELAQFGARVLHPLTIEPARTHRIVLRVRSMDDPASMTTIGPAQVDHGTRALSLLTPLRMLRLRVAGGRQRPGIVSEVAGRLALAEVNLVQLFTSSALLCLLVEPKAVRATMAALRPMTVDAATTIDGPFSIALVTAIGDGVLDDLARIPAGLLKGSQGLSATPRAVSVAVAERRGQATLRALHRVLVARSGA